MNWEIIGYAVGALFLGCALRTLLPYVTTGLKIVGESGKWSDWPRFEPAYLTAFALALIIYAVSFLTIPGAWESALETPFIYLVGLSYAGQDVTREVIKAGSAVAASRR